MLNTINLFNRDKFAKDPDGNRTIYSAKIIRNDLTNLGDDNYNPKYQKHRPLKIYRKQYDPENKKSNISSIGVFDKPGLSSKTTKLDKECLDCCNNNLYNENILNSKNKIDSCNGSAECKFYDASLNKIVCIASNPENNIIKSASTIITESYSYNTNQLLHRRNKTFNQNQFGVPEYKYQDNNNNNSGNCCKEKIIVSQNRNSSSSSGRIAKLKHETSKTFKKLTPSYQQQIKQVGKYPTNQCRNNNLLFRNQMMKLSCPTN